MVEELSEYSAKDIVVLEGLEAVRRRPGMYIGDVRDGSGLLHMLWEVVANSLDEHLAGRASRIRVSIEGDIAEVEDNGRGIPVEIIPGYELPFLQVVLTSLHRGPTFDRHVPHVHISPFGFGLGLAVVNALSKELEVEVWRDGYTWRQRYTRGKPLSLLERGARTERTGTRLRFRPDPTIFSVTHFDRAAVRQRIEELAIWNPELTWELMSEAIREPAGTARWIERMADENAVAEISEIFVTRALRNDVFVEIACAWSEDDEFSELRSFVGQSLTDDGGTHVRGFWEGLVTAIAQRLPNASARAKRVSLQRRRLKPGLLAVVHVGLRHPDFSGPTRSRLESEEARIAVREQMAEAFGEHLARHPELAEMLAGRVLRAEC